MIVWIVKDNIFVTQTQIDKSKTEIKINEFVPFIDQFRSVLNFLSIVSKICHLMFTFIKNVLVCQ